MNTLRDLLRNLYIDICGKFAKPCNSIHILNSHFISRTDPNPDVFTLLLRELNKHVDFVDIDVAVQLVLNKSQSNRPLVAFTFDDGFEECYTMIAPVLEEFDIKGAFFINPGFIDGNALYKNDFVNNKVLTPGKNPMNWDMITDLQNRGHIIGSHTLDHIRLNLNDQQIISHQVKKSKEIIESKMGTLCEYFAYPYGQTSDISDEALAICLSLYKYIFSGTNYKKYFSRNGQVINRRHIEGDWDFNHVKYFLSHQKMF